MLRKDHSCLPDNVGKNFARAIARVGKTIDFARAIALLIKCLLKYAQIKSRSNEKKCER